MVETDFEVHTGYAQKTRNGKMIIFIIVFIGNLVSAGIAYGIGHAKGYNKAYGEINEELDCMIDQVKKIKSEERGV